MKDKIYTRCLIIRVEYFQVLLVDYKITHQNKEYRNLLLTRKLVRYVFVYLKIFFSQKLFDLEKLWSYLYGIKGHLHKHMFICVAIILYDDHKTTFVDLFFI